MFVSYTRIEKGVPTVTIAIYLWVLYAPQLYDDILLLAKETTTDFTIMMNNFNIAKLLKLIKLLIQLQNVQLLLIGCVILKKIITLPYNLIS